MSKKFLLIFIMFTLAPSSALAALGGEGGEGVGGGGGGGVGGGSSNTVVLENPLGPNIEDFSDLVKVILDAAFIIGMPVAVLFIVIAGFRFVWARGNPGQLEKARQNLLYTVIGIAVFFGAWTLARIIEATITALKVGGS